MRKSFYVTTPIYYVNDVAHIGHMYTTVAADTIARYKRMCGFDTYFLTGTDEHGQKIQQAADKKGVTPQALADSVVKRFHELWKQIDVTHNQFIRTTDEKHKACVQKIFQKLMDQGDIYLGEYEGWYCTPCEAFWTDTQLMEGQLCPDCGRPTAKAKEPTYFFKMSKFQDRLLEHIEKNPGFIKPESRKNEIVSFVREGLRDLSVSRTSFSWGIQVPTDPKHVIYVWIDALANYLSALGYLTDDEQLYKKYWPANYHLVGKDILRFHAVYWPTMLMALGLELPKSIYAHGWWTVEGQKMSKSIGNVIDPFKLTDMFGVDTVKYFMLKEVTFGLDADFSYKALIHRINSDLANDFGNLATRTFGMLNRYFDGVVQPYTVKDEAADKIRALIKESAVAYNTHMNELAFNKALAAVWDIVWALNKYIDDMQPWNLAKMPEKKERLGSVLYTALDGLRALSMFITPFMPNAATLLQKQLNIPENITLKDESELGKTAIYPSGQKIGEVVALFPRLDEAELMAKLTAESKPAEVKKTADTASVGVIEFADFEKVQLIAGKVQDAEKIQKSDKLLKLQVNDGAAVRTIVAGIAKSFTPEEMKGKTIAILANLKPAKLMGVESNGMVLAAFDGERHHLLVLPDSVPAGTRIK